MPIPNRNRQAVRGALLALVLAATLAPSAPVRADDEIPLAGPVHVPGGQGRTTLRLHKVTIKDALQTLAEQAHLSFVIDQSVNGMVDLDYFNVPLDSVLDSLVTANALTVQRRGGSYIFYKQGSNTQEVVLPIPLQYANAAALAAQLGPLLGSGTGAAGSGSSGPAKGKPQITADPRSNTLLVAGAKADVLVVQELVRRLDVMLPSQVFKLNNLSPQQAIDLLHDTYFGAAGTAGAGGTTTTPVKVRGVDFSKVVPGTMPTVTETTVNVPDGGPKFVPLEQANAILAIATPQDLAVVSKLLAEIDVKPKQVLIKAEVVEISETDANTLGLNWDVRSKQFGLGQGFGSLDDGQFNMNSLTNQAAQLQLQIKALVTANRAKVLASPMVLAMDNRSSKILITDDIIDTVQTQQVINNNLAQTTTTINKGTTGITLDFTPHVDGDGDIEMNVHPKIAFVKDQEKDAQGNIIATLQSNREFQTQEIRIRDGQTIVIGGLIQDRVQDDERKLPGLGDIPFLGRLFQFKSHTTTRTEVKILITPEVVPDGPAKAVTGAL